MEPLTIEDELRNLKWSVNSLAELGRQNGSYDAENARNVARGICARIDWCLDQIAEASNLTKRR